MGISKNEDIKIVINVENPTHNRISILPTEILGLSEEKTYTKTIEISNGNNI